MLISKRSNLCVRRIDVDGDVIGLRIISLNDYFLIGLSDIFMAYDERMNQFVAACRRVGSRGNASGDGLICFFSASEKAFLINNQCWGTKNQVLSAKSQLIMFHLFRIKSM
uniref:Uncharacterized protein n=1 Tax=Glossina austeni TaxID=7395 RepID=A0A1A9V344_GLOAU